MAKQKYDFDLVVIGSGAGGSVAADIVASAKWRVAIVEDAAFGGDILSLGSIPSKALLRAAEVYDLAKTHGPAMGLRSASIGYNYPSIRAWKDLVVKRSGALNSERYYASRGISILHGAARFLSPHEITVNRRHVTARHFLVATGGIPADGGVAGLDKTPHLTTASVLDSIRPPRSLFIIGGGASGCEFAELFSVFGSKVTIAEEAARLLPTEDEEVSEVITKTFKTRRGMTVLPRTKVVRIAKEGIATRVTYLKGSEEHSVKVDQVLLAAGKVPHIDIGLENAGVHYTKEGIETNEYLATSASHIYAAGDVLGRFMYAHSAVYESRLVAHNLLSPKRPAKPDYAAVSRVTFLSPEVASVGMSEADCLKRDLTIKIGMAPLNAIARSNIDNVRDGFVKVITTKQGQLVGATVVAPHAGEIIHELSLAIQYGLTASEVAGTIHAFPSWSEAVRVACAKVK